MKSLMLYIAALPLAALAAGQETGLENAVAITDILDAKVLTTDGRELGKVGDVVFGGDGKVREYLVDVHDLQEEYNRGVTSFGDDVADYGESPVYEGDSRESELELEFVAAAPDQLELDGTTLKVNTRRSPIAAMPQKDGDVSRPGSGIYARDVIGMTVDLADAESFGSVEEVLLDAEGKQVLAYVVDNWDGLTKYRRALRADAADFRPEEQKPLHETQEVQSIVFDITEEEISAMPEFDLDTVREKKWNWDFNLR